MGLPTKTSGRGAEPGAPPTLYSLVLARAGGGGAAKAVGDDVFLHNLSDEYKVFVLYYPSVLRNEELERLLRELGELGGSNLFVDIGKYDDPAFDKIVKAFGIERFPVVVVTATVDLAGARRDGVNCFVRIDAERLLSDQPGAIRLVEELYALFLRGDVAAAIAREKRRERSALVGAVAAAIAAGLRHVGGFVADRDIKVSVLEGTFELTKSGS